MMSNNTNNIYIYSIYNIYPVLTTLKIFFLVDFYIIYIGYNYKIKKLLCYLIYIYII